MCGIVGIAAPGWRGLEVAKCAGRMARTLHHRGPDDHGVWSDEEGGVALGHRRLAIVDLSPLGRQPMLSARGRYVIAYNGEVYNFLELRRELEGAGWSFRGTSDTEVILAAFEQWGFEASLRRFVGMFAMGVWDRNERVLLLARDRLGKKPLYVAVVAGRLLFASELKAMHAVPGFEPTLDREALALFLRHNYVPGPWTIYREVVKLPPGHSLRVRPSDLSGLSARDLVSRAEPYWSALETARQGQAEPFRGTPEEAVEELDRLLRDAVAIRMIADVPLGALLSGGIDSSLVAALMQAQSGRPVRTYTIGFRTPNFDEAGYAQTVARHLGTEHTELYVEPEDALRVIPELPRIWDEPFSDSSQIPTYLVCWLARQHVTVALSGDGGDESFGGYNRYFLCQRLQRAVDRLPIQVRRLIARGIHTMAPEVIDRALSAFGLLMRGNSATGLSGDRLHKLADVFDVPDMAAAYRRFVAHWQNPEELVIGARVPQTVWDEEKLQTDLQPFEHYMMAVDTVTYLPDDILVKVDRASMAVSLEARCPLLDHRVVEFAWRLPLEWKIRDGKGKWILRKVLERYLPRELFERPKMGFGVPLADWLRGPLRDWAEELIDEHRLRREGILNPEPIRRRWRDHLSGRRNWAYHLWDVLMFQSWYECWHGNGRVREGTGNTAALRATRAEA